MNNYIEYHLRGICTEKGLNILTQVIAKEKLVMNKNILPTAFYWRVLPLCFLKKLLILV